LAHRAVEADVFAYVGLFDAPLDVIPEHLARRVGADRPAEVVIEAVIGELQSLLGAVGPEIAVHAAVDRLAVLVQAGAPGVVPQATPVGLLFVTDQFGDLAAQLLGGLECAELGQATGAGADDGYSHIYFL